MDLRTTAYAVGVISLALYVLYQPFEVYDALAEQNRLKAALKALALLVSVVIVAVLLAHPPG